MEKPILATTLKSVIINSKSWEDAHYLWYDEREKELKIKGLSIQPIIEWKTLLKENPEKEKKVYFNYVDKVMITLYPDLSKEKRTKIARKSYFDSVIKFIKDNKNQVNYNIIDYFYSLKNKYRLAIITTNTQSALEKIIKSINLDKDLFDLIETSKPEEKDNKISVFKRFVKKYGKPSAYIGFGEETMNYCKSENIPHILVDFEKKSDSKDVVRNLKELKEKISLLKC